MTIDVDPLLLAFPPQFAAFAGTVRPPQPEAVALPALLTPAVLAGVIDRYAAALPTQDRRAALSMWSQYYLLALVPAALATLLVGVRAPDFCWSTAGAVLSADGRPIAVCLLPAAGPALTPVQNLVSLFRAHLVPLAQELAATGLPAPVFWSNAVHVLFWALQMLQGPPDRLAELSRLLETATWPDGAANPLGPLQRAALRAGTRNACCLRHKIPAMPRCASCPATRAAAGLCRGSACTPCGST